MSRRSKWWAPSAVVARCRIPAAVRRRSWGAMWPSPAALPRWFTMTRAIGAAERVPVEAGRTALAGRAHHLAADQRIVHSGSG